jgi:hypothetical protein
MANTKPALEVTDVDTLCQFAARGVALGFQHWYTRAQAEIEQICEAEGWNPQEFTEILALLSPRCAVRRNIRVALQYMTHGEFFVDTIKSVRRSVEVYRHSGEIRGKKTGPFAQALLGDGSAIVLDTWMAKALLCCEINPTSNSFQRVKTRQAANDVVRHVAARFSISPAQAQACIWAGVFEAFGGKPPFFPIVEEYERFKAYGKRFPTSGYIADEPTEFVADDSNETF